jgi:hypothetical protein
MKYVYAIRMNGHAKRAFSLKDEIPGTLNVHPIRNTRHFVGAK